VKDRRLVVTARSRGGRLDEMPSTKTDPVPAEIVALAGPAAGWLWLGGGEPTLRADLPALIRALAGHRVGVASDALALGEKGAVAPLVAAKLAGVRVTVHSARADAHDWLVDRPGALRRAIRAIGVLRELGVAVELAATVTRPTTSHLPELAELAAELSVRRLHLARPVGRGAVADEMVALAPRWALLEPWLERTAEVASRRGVALAIHGFPLCALGSAASFAGEVEWLVPAGWDGFGDAPATERCPRCPPACAGAPDDYVARFGRGELRSEVAVAMARPHASPPEGRAGLAPTTRARVVEVARGAPPAALRVAFGAPSPCPCEACGEGGSVEPTRAVRLRLARAAQEGARTLRVASAGSLHHPEAPALLREATLLSFARVEVAGDAAALDAAPDAALYGLAGFARLDAALFAADAAAHDAHAGVAGSFDASLRTLGRFERLARAEVGCYGVLHDASTLGRFARAWEEVVLPGQPCFRLSPRGGALSDLAAAPESMRPALLPVVPACVLPRDPGWRPAERDERAFEASPSGLDRYGMFEPCRCGPELAQACPGVARGWQL
jgi:hypothetical protein